MVGVGSWRVGCSWIAVATLVVPATASAAELGTHREPLHATEYEAAPATVFIPLEAIPLVPSSVCPVPQAGENNSALGCVEGLDEAQDYAPPADPMAIVDGLEAALAPYDVRVTTVRPPAYVPYMMLLPRDTIDMEATSRTCVAAGIDCDGPRRNDIGFTFGGTANCVDPDPVQTALIAFGYLSGLENTATSTDPMFYPPDFTAPSHAFVDACAAFVPTLDEEGKPNLGLCVSAYHEVHCDDVDDTVNSDLELRGVYGDGPPAVDVTPPVAQDVGIVGVDRLPSGSGLPLTATITDDSGIVFVRWTMSTDSGVLDKADVDGDGAICKSHNGVCELEFTGEIPYRQNANDSYPASELQFPPDGLYFLRLEAADLAGNEMVPYEAMIAIGGEGGDTTTDGGESADDSDPDPDTSTSVGNDSEPDPDDDAGEVDAVTGDEPGDDDDDDDGGDTTTSAGATDAIASRGCSCRVAPDRSAWLLVGVVALMRRRRSASRAT